MAVCCSSYHEATLSIDTMSGELELEEPPWGRAGLVNTSVWCLFSYFKNQSADCRLNVSWGDITLINIALLSHTTTYWEPVQHKRSWIPKSLSYLPCPANPFPDTEVHKDPGDGQRYRQVHSNLAWCFQAIGHVVHVAPISQSEQQWDYYTHTHTHTGK